MWLIQSNFFVLFSPYLHPRQSRSQKVQALRNVEEISKLKLFGFRIVKAM